MTVPENIRSFVDQQSIVALATAAPKRIPNVAPIFWKFWYDDGTLLLLDNYMKTTKANIQAAGTASVSVWNAASGEAYQLKGTAEYLTQGLHMNAAVTHMEKSNQENGQKVWWFFA